MVRKEGVESSDDNLQSMQLQSVANSISWYDIYTKSILDHVACYRDIIHSNGYTTFWLGGLHQVWLQYDKGTIYIF